jgi:hypothetical protein
MCSCSMISLSSYKHQHSLCVFSASQDPVSLLCCRLSVGMCDSHSVPLFSMCMFAFFVYVCVCVCVFFFFACFTFLFQCSVGSDMTQFQLREWFSSCGEITFLRCVSVNILCACVCVCVCVYLSVYVCVLVLMILAFSLVCVCVCVSLLPSSLPLDKNSGRVRGFAFVEFVTKEAAAKVGQNSHVDVVKNNNYYYHCISPYTLTCGRRDFRSLFCI